MKRKDGRFKEFEERTLLIMAAWVQRDVNKNMRGRWVDSCMTKVLR